MSEIDYTALKNRALAQRKPNSGSSLIFGDQNKPAPSGTSSNGFNPQRLAQYKPIFEKYFRPEDVGKAMWTSFWENPEQVPVSSVGPNPPQGRATGLLQILPRYEDNGRIINPDRPTQQELMDPETNIRYAAELVYGKSGKASGAPSKWTDWQDGYDPKSGQPIWGALAKHPYPGDIDPNKPQLPITPLPTDFQDRKNQAITQAEQASQVADVASTYLNIVKSRNEKAFLEEVSKLKQPKPSLLSQLPRFPVITPFGAIGGDSLTEEEKEYNRQASAIKEKYDAETREATRKSVEAATISQAANDYAFLLASLEVHIADKTTNIKSIEDLEKYWMENSGTNLTLPWGMGSHGRKPQLTEEQRKYIDSAIKHLAPYVNNPMSAPDTQRQLAEFLTAAGGSNIPSHRVSIASLSTDQIKKLLKTSPSGAGGLPAGITKEKLDAWLKSKNLVDPEAKAEIDKLEGASKDLIQRWRDQNSRYEAYKLGILDPTNALPTLKARESNVITWGLDKLEVYSKNVVRPIAAYGLSGLGSITDLIPQPLQNVLPGAFNPNMLFDLTSSNLDDLRREIRQNRNEGQNWWTAAGNGFEEWDANVLVKMLAETVADPTTYLGFGLYPKIVGKVPILGKAVNAVELGWKVAWDNPVMTKVSTSIAGAAIGYTISGGEEWGAIGGAGLPVLRYVPLYSARQLTDKVMYGPGGVNATLNEAILVSLNKASLDGTTGADIRQVFDEGLEILQNNPTTGHLTPQGRTVLTTMNILDPWIDNGDRIIGIWRNAGEEALPPASAFTDETATMRMSIPNVTQDQLLAINNSYRKLFYSEQKGILPLDVVADEISNILGMSYKHRDAIKEAITNRWDDLLGSVRRTLDGDDGAEVYKKLGDSLEAKALDGYKHPLNKYAAFQGLVIGLSRQRNPTVRANIFQLMSGFQTWYARSMLWFFNFAPMNFIETHIRAGIGGGGWSVPLAADNITSAQYQFGWNSDMPQALREGGRDNFEVVRTRRGESNIEELSKRKRFINGLADIAQLGFMNRLGNQVQAAFYHKIIPQEWARLAPQHYTDSKSLVQSLERQWTTQGLSKSEVESRATDIMNGLLRPDAPQYIRGLKQDLSTANRAKLAKDVYEATQKYQRIDPVIADKVVRDIQAGRVGRIDETFEENLDLILDMPAVQAERASQALKDTAARIEDILNPVPPTPDNPITATWKNADHDEPIEIIGRYGDRKGMPYYRVKGTRTGIPESEIVGASRELSGVQTPEELAGLVKFITDANQTITSAQNEMRRSATRRGTTVKGEANKTKHWTASNEALDGYLSSSIAEYPKMVASVRRRIGELFPDREVQLNALLDNLERRNASRVKVRQDVQKLYDDFRAKEGRQPRGVEFENIRTQEAEIWDNYFAREDQSLIEYQTLAEKVEPTAGSLSDVSSGTLTLQNVAQLLVSSGDEMAQSLVQGSSLQRKETWVSAVYGRAKAKAESMGKTPEQLGWTTEGLNNIYDGLRIRMGTDPTKDGALYVALDELENLRKDVHMAAINHGYKPSDIEVINEGYEQAALLAEKNPLSDQARKQIFERGRLRYEHTFTDYTNENIFDSFMRGIFPFWFYQASRWPYLAREALKHPGLVTGYGRFQNYTEEGYTHIPGLDLAFNVARGTILMGGLSGLIRQFPATYEDSIFGDFQHALDNLGKAGFYPGIWTTIPLAGAGLIDFELSPAFDAPVNISHNITGNRILYDLRERYFPSKFRTYYNMELASKLSEQRGLGVSGNEIKRKIDEGSATEEERAVWAEAQREMSGYQFMFDQTGIFKLDIEQKRAAANELAEFIYSKTGITKEQQDAITDRLGDSGYRLLDVFPLDPESAKELYEITKYKYWTGNASSLQPKEFQVMQQKIESFWAEVEKIQTRARETGFTDSNGRQLKSLAQLDTEFRDGTITAREYLQLSAATKARQSQAIETLKQEERYKEVPITLEQREEYRRKHNMPMPVQHPAKELLDMYHGLRVTTDPVTGESDWNKYFASVDAIIEALPDEHRGYLLEYIQKEWTPSQKLYWQTNSQFIRPYMNLREGILQEVIPAQQEFIRDYMDVSAAVIDNLPEEAAKLIRDFNSAVSRAREKYRQLNPETEAWLYYWGKITSLQSEAARKKYNSIIAQFGGGVPYTNPIDEKKTKPLPALP